VVSGVRRQYMGGQAGMASTSLQGEVVALADRACELDDGLHALHLALDVRVEILLLDLGKTEEVHRTRVDDGRVCGDERPQALVQILRQERRVRRLSCG
jgi:hypothetical protein